MKRYRRIGVLGIVLLLLLLLLAACTSGWTVELARPDGTTFSVDRALLKDLSDFSETVEGEEVVPLERVLWTAGHRAVESLEFVDPSGNRQRFDWAEVAEQAWWRLDGSLWIDGAAWDAARLEVEPPALLGQVQAQIIDVAPTVAAALGLPAPARSSGNVLEVPRARHVLVVFLDGFGYVRYGEALEAGLIPHLGGLGRPLLGLTVYPPVTVVATASLLTGALPGEHEAVHRGIRQTEVETIFDVAAAAGLRVVAVEGDSLAFNLRSAETQLSGDRDGNGTSDDNVLANALAVLEEGMPDLLFVHFHGIDDTGHTYGPGAAEEQARIRAVDEAVGQILQELPPDTVVIIFADHGMHAVEEEGRLGNHGHLIERDIFIPIWIVQR